MIKGGMRASIQRMWDSVAYARGFIDCDNISARCMLTIFALFATKTEASLLRMLKGYPDVYLSGPIKKYIIEKGGRFHLRWGCREVLYETSSDGSMCSGLAMSKHVMSLELKGQYLRSGGNWNSLTTFTNWLEYDGWVTELQDLERSRQLKCTTGLDNLLYTLDTDFSCFANLTLASPGRLLH